MRSPTRRSEKQVAPNYFFYMHIASCAAAPSPNFYKLRIKIVRSALMGLLRRAAAPLVAKLASLGGG